MEDKLNKIFKHIFRGKISFSADLKRENSPMWDSLTHVKICIAIEKEFNIRFDGADAVEMNSGTKILQILQSKLS